VSRGRDDERGAIAVITAVASVLLFAVAALTVDIGNAWAVRGLLQVQADSAAVYAADALPVTTSGSSAASSQLTVAKRVAYQVVCHPVRGQRSANPAMPATCPSSPTDNSLSAYAQSLLDSGAVSFPTTTQVTVVSPTARVDFGLGAIAGADGTTEAKTGTARVYSPGTAAPIALSLQCALSAAGTVPGFGDLASSTVPLNYVAAGALGPASTAEPDSATTLATMPAGTSSATLTGVVPGSTTQGQSASVSVSFAGVGAIATGLVRVHFYRGTERQPADPPTQVAYSAVLGSATSAAIPVPEGVSNTAGVWFVQAEFKPTGSASWTTTSKASHGTFTVNPPAGLTSLTACGNLVDSPRADTNNTVGAAGALRKNIKEGLDHALTTHPALVTLSPPATVNATNVVGVLNGGLVSCSPSSPSSVMDTDATRTSPLANCVTVATDGARATEFTEGFVGDTSGAFKGRLNCSVDPTSCAHGSFTLSGFPGQTYNNDTLTDYTAHAGLLGSSLFWGLSTYLTDEVPAVTPPSSALDSDLYESPRFMWVAVASRAVGATACTQCPVLTFRPLFITQQQPTGMGAVDSLTSQLSSFPGVITSMLFPWLSSSATSSDHGVVMDGTGLRALRFQTIEPSALPVPPLDYTGPVTDYLGTGPRVIRVVR
jgi:Flp pilus assembly protein TadG